MPYLQKHVFICVNRREEGNPKGSCAQKGSEAVREQFKKQLHEHGLKTSMRANGCLCLDQCANGPAVCVYPEQAWYGHVRPEDVQEIIERHLVRGELVERLLLPNQPHLEPALRAQRASAAGQ